MYFDDLIGDDVWLCNVFTGEHLAINEFNQRHRTRKIVQNYSLPVRYPHELRWPHNIYIYHDFEHPKYNAFVPDSGLKIHQDNIRLR
jgi:hypothetical protein